MAGHATSGNTALCPSRTLLLILLCSIPWACWELCLHYATHFEAHPVQQAVQYLEGGEGGWVAQATGKPRWVAPRCKALQAVASSTHGCHSMLSMPSVPAMACWS